MSDFSAIGKTNPKTDPSNPSVSVRIEWADVARGIAIVLVVIAHVNAGLMAAHLSGKYELVIKHVNSFIDSFHMTVFFILSGMFADRAIVKSSREFWSEKVGGLVYPYFLWSTIQLAVQCSLSGYTNTPATWRDFSQLFYQPVMQFWFLYCLFVGLVAFRIVTRFGGTPLAFFLFVGCFSLVISIFEFPGTTILGRVRDNLPHFALGILFSSSLQRLENTSSSALIAVVVCGFAFSVTMSGLGLSQNVLFPRLLNPLPATAALLALSVLIARRGLHWGLVALGRLSLEIYLVHVLAYSGARIMMVHAFGITSVSILFITGVTFGIGLPLCVATICYIFQFPFLFRWPTSKARGVPGHYRPN